MHALFEDIVYDPENNTRINYTKQFLSALQSCSELIWCKLIVCINVLLLQFSYLAFSKLFFFKSFLLKRYLITNVWQSVFSVFCRDIATFDVLVLL